MKRDLPIKRVSTDLDVLRFPAEGEHVIQAQCLTCSVPLALSQPDLDSPERLLGVCGICKKWFLIDLIPDQTEGLLLRLPDTEMMRRLSIECASEGQTGEP
jgi:hypothetical protein